MYYCLKRIEVRTMSDRCHRCEKPVYFAEECRALNKKFHKLCLKCAKCNKLLDSTSCTDHEDEIYCKSCYGRNFGPKGYGFGGASGLSLDNEQGVEGAKKTASHYNQAQGAPIIERMNSVGSLGFGGGDSCPRCSQRVYFAEEARAVGKKWHKMCLRCAKCGKMLDSTTLRDHEKEVYCRPCHSKNFGPKGYGFAGGASGLSMDTGSYGEITRENVSSYAQAQAAPLLDGSGKGDICGRCSKKVYFAELVMGGGNSYHKHCFRCGMCGKGLDSTTVKPRENEIFCNNCYSKSFGPKGFGFGSAMQHT